MHHGLADYLDGLELCKLRSCCSELGHDADIQFRYYQEYELHRCETESPQLESEYEYKSESEADEPHEFDSGCFTTSQDPWTHDLYASGWFLNLAPHKPN